jgi:hypothetical protein
MALVPLDGSTAEPSHFDIENWSNKETLFCLFVLFVKRLTD